MPDKQQKTKRKFTTLGLLGLVLTGSVLFHASFGSRFAIAAVEETAASAPEQVQEIDLDGSSEAFIDFARGADILVMHMPVPEGISGVARRLHAPPGVIGDIATATGAGKLVLSHFMARSLSNINHNLEVVRSRYNGPVVSSDDLQCINF